MEAKNLYIFAALLKDVLKVQ